ncbi:uncharacterized protein C5L36_0A05315 [Pichia kudriavzevii]|uniref:Dolichyl-diphosphooligosaccharide-protein glycosyltransferase subunit OST5 n=1 Tax=Pichia kudriavzevii TaxID=4909 RepID=A0A2U9QY67_PICKU|nr:uncharacterized protein C5L36_0A05315 [Pichia kudriavzevii]AWU73935.1 hypothetical protein C5L36_0A05315 [Pichia kudriavzevii]
MLYSELSPGAHTNSKMASFNELMSLYTSYSELTPSFTSSLNTFPLVVSVSFTLLLLLLTLSFSVESKSARKSMLNFIEYTVLSALTALSLSFTILFVSSHVGIYT